MRLRSPQALLFTLSLIATASCAMQSNELPPEETSTGSAQSALNVSQGSHTSHVGFQAAWVDVGMPLGATPTLASWGPGRVDLFVRNGDKLLQKTWTDGTGWSPKGDEFWPLTSGLASEPAAVGWWGRNVDIVFHNAAGELIHRYYYEGDPWREENLGGYTEGRPTITVSPDGRRMDVFSRVGNAVWHRGWSGWINGWNAWEPVGITVESDPSRWRETSG